MVLYRGGKYDVDKGKGLREGGVDFGQMSSKYRAWETGRSGGRKGRFLTRGRAGSLGIRRWNGTGRRGEGFPGGALDGTGHLMVRVEGNKKRSTKGRQLAECSGGRLIRGSRVG